VPPLTNLLQEYKLFIYQIQLFKSFNFNKDSFILSKVFLNIYFAPTQGDGLERELSSELNGILFSQETDFPLSTAWLVAVE